MRIRRLAAAIGLALVLPGTALAATDKAKADADRKKPLQRCDQLNGKAHLECLKKARENIVEARKKRESAATQAKTPAGKTADAGETVKNIRKH